MANDALDTDNAWDLVLSAINRSNITLPVPGTDQPAVKINGKSWELVQPASEQARNLLSLFLPLCQPVTNNSRVIGQLGQSLDGRIATVTGCSRFINGDDGITHLHRIRALCDAVVVGAGTASTDNPRLTVRRTSGRNPVRVVIDRRQRVPASHHLFTDGDAPTLHLIAGDYQPGPKAMDPDGVTTVPCLGSAENETPASPERILQVLQDFGLRKIFIEGGGVTVSSFLKAGLLDRLHVMVAPMIIGSGRPAFSLPEIDQLDEALRPKAQLVNLGSDMLFDLAFDTAKP
ncbi:RibD family protein [Marinobacter nauticus]|uniref:RibD family protein n=1 Tax=Marinobacter nauticus TaxID=2743 RepID=UPI001A8E2C97|nr:RibD family protein [Marinobacter nauticus]MBN8238043.1 RibD family protein [Marinobacter nauticus]MBY5936167.1 RibD family protein [Marinobacter nauticus]MBY5953396.1 RibD family protein [Marinobacter nauticus]MBY6007189.1 RibD family protein [Marinobacter nauticus]